MELSVHPRHITFVLVVVAAIGTAGWVAPFVQTPNAGGSGYSVERVYIQADDRITTATLYLPDGDEQVPGFVFGAGSGTAPALYTNYGAALATNGFAVLVAGQTRELEPGRPIYWEIRRDNSGIFDLAADNYANWATYLASHPRVDGERLVLGGHSGGANSAYRVAYQRADVNGVVAVAGRFPPETEDPFPTNLLLATGSEDSLVPPSKLTDVSRQLTGTALQPGQQVGSFANGTATRVTVAEGATHLSESDNPELVRETTEWALRSVGESPPTTLGITVRSIGSVLYQFLFGFVGVLAGTALTKRTLEEQIDDGQPRDGVVTLVWLAGFALVLHTTVSQRVYHFGPMPAQSIKYVLLGGLLLGVGSVLDRAISSTSWADSRIGSALFDLGFLTGSVGTFMLLSTQFVTFQLVTTVVLSSVVFVVLAAVLAELTALTVERRYRWAVLGVVVLWLVPAIVPPYL